MTLIADGGSTKCDWILLGYDGEVLMKTRTKGLNPAVIAVEDLFNRLKENEDLVAIFNVAETVDFYGAGAGTKTPNAILTKVLQEVFPKAVVTVNEDLLAAVLAATTEPGIVCILGTGSNSCYFDGEKIHSNVPSLGYILMDEASGNYFGKRLIRDYYYQKMPEQLMKEFEKRFDLDPDVIKMNVYQRPNPNTYLASFAEFIFTAEEVNGYFWHLISEGMKRFIEYRVLCYKEAQNVPVHFIGSIAHFSEEMIRNAMKPYHLQLGKIIRRPIDGLIDYYREHRLKVKS
ncbi:MAG TPA: N-acetylglucosamine kinase [Flavobacteriaceae bacterium]|nr:N-acetylglucosamine kinase [Flavobacteriaceae bacterium]MCB9213547.1 N-acetylglucosamine kinase [Alteromonas sp.]HPF10773.1 N-acetylglucosamine kinase [Flavobacteriaceae bacterium]HQU21519.1 N-acetylglucosamine kinase [Flavobacteriaceae bacterium]HQU65488.1 N-acetylglucosamine kinase [Flavobacteriaceae bacterium]